MTIIKALKMLILTVVGACITLCCLPVILPIYIILYIARSFVKLLIKIKYQNRATLADGTDVLISAVKPKSYAVINIASRTVGQMDVPKYKSRLANVLRNTVDQKGRPLYKRLTQIYCRECGYATWKDYDQFDVDQHASIISIEDLIQKNIEKETNSKNGPVTTTHVEKLQKLVNSNQDIDWNFLMKIFLNEVGSKKMSSEMPQWQVIFLEENKERYTMIFRFHHAISDGIFMTRFITEVFQDEPAELFHNYVPPSRLKSFLFSLWCFILFPIGVLKMLKSNDKNLLHGKKLSGKKRFYLSNSFEMETLRSIRKRTKIGTTNIMFSCLSNAVASHFSRRSATEKDITVVIPAPRQNLQKSLKMKNKFVLLYMKVPTPPRMNTNIKGALKNGCSSLERLKLIKSVFDDAKGDPVQIAADSTLTTLCSILPLRVSEFMLDTKGITIDFSNLPGPQTGLHFGEDCIEELMFWINDHDPLGVGVGLLSYNGKFKAGLCIDEALLEDETEGDLFLQDFVEEVKNISQELDNQQSTLDDRKLEETKFLKQYS